MHAREGCGGCGWQHVAVDAQPQLKLDIIRDALNRIAHIADAPLADPVLLPTEGFRTTVRALVVDGKPAFRKHQSHDPVMIDSCLVAHPAIDELLREGKFGRATEVTLRVGGGTGERAALAEPAEIIMDLPPDVMRGKNAMVHEVIDGHTMRVSINSFFQSRTDGAATLARLVREATGPDKRDRRPVLRRRPLRGDRRPTQADRRGRTGPLRGRRCEAQPQGPRRARRPAPTSASGRATRSTS